MNAPSNHRMVAFIAAGVIAALTIQLLIAMGEPRLVVILLAGYSILLSALIIFFRPAS
jgi:hypothetical protein